MIRRHYPPEPFTADTRYLYAAWRAVLERAERNEWYQGAADRADVPAMNPATWVRRAIMFARF
jgi:hypothetical protein